MRRVLLGVAVAWSITSCLLSVRGLHGTDEADARPAGDAGPDTTELVDADEPADVFDGNDRDGDGRDVEPFDADDGGADATDADRPSEPVGPVDLSTAGPNGAHPAVTWTGSQFAVGYVVASGGVQHVEVVRFAPGEEPPDVGERITAEGGAYEDVSLAASGERLAVGWTAETFGSWEARARVLPDDPVPRTIYSPLSHQGDRDDAHVHWVGGGLAVAVRSLEILGDALCWLAVDEPGNVELVATRVDSVGELVLRTGSAGPMVATGNGTTVFVRAATGWKAAFASDLGAGSEGDVAELDDGTLLTVWLHDPTGLGERVLDSVVLEPVALGYAQRAQARLPFLGSDPALATVPAGALLAFSYTPSETERVLGLVLLDAEGLPIDEPCAVASSRPVANDPDVACTEGYCAVVWMEASAYDGTDFITRIVQVPTDGGLICP